MRQAEGEKDYEVSCYVYIDEFRSCIFEVFVKRIWEKELTHGVKKWEVIFVSSNLEDTNKIGTGCL